MAKMTNLQIIELIIKYLRTNQEDKVNNVKKSDEAKELKEDLKNDK